MNSPKARTTRHVSLQNKERGATLLVGMIFLVVLMLLGVSAASISTVDEKMARNLRDQNIAFQAAEAALRDARNDILQSRKLSGFTGFPSDAGTCSDDVNYKGLCQPSVEGKQVWELYFDDDSSSKFIKYGEKTGLGNSLKFVAQDGAGSPDLRSIKKQPRYLIEVLPDPASDSSMSIPSKPKVLYRITSMGYGATEGTNVLLQEVIRP